MNVRYDYGPSKHRRSLEGLTPETLLSAQEIAALLHISTGVIRQWRIAGGLKSVYLSHTTAYRWGDVVAWISKQM